MPRPQAQPHFDPPYDAQLEAILEFASFSAAEKTLFKLEKLRQGYLTAGDMKGVEYCRRLGLLGRRRAGICFVAAPRGASHLPARPSRQNVNSFLRQPLGYARG